MNIANETALLRLSNKSSTDLTGYEGCIAAYDSGLKLSAGSAAFGVIVGTFHGIVRGKASGTIAVGDKLVVDSAGKVKALPESAGTYLVVGVAVQAGVADELVEFAPWQPVSVTVS